MEPQEQTKAKEMPEGLTEADVKKLVMQHGQLYPITVKKDGRRITGLFKKPTLSIMAAANAGGGADLVKVGTIVFNSCKVHVPAEMESDDEVKLAALNKVGGLFRVLEAEVGEPFA